MSEYREAPLPIVVLHWNRPVECAKTVGLLLQQGLDVSVTVVDNASREEDFKKLKRRLPSEVIIHRLPENFGWGGALNRALNDWIGSSGSEYCVLSAHDAIPSGDCLRNLVRAMEQDSSMGIACPSYNLPEIARFSRLGGIKALRVSEPPADAVSMVDVPHGTLMIIRRQCWTDVGGFDERYFAYGDEGEIGLRAKEKKWNVGLVWGAFVVNPGTWTPGSVVTYLTARNSLLTVSKHAGSVAAIVRMALMALNTGRLVFCGRIPLSMGRIRLTAIKDFIIGNFGRPPQDILQVGSQGTGA